MCKMPPVTALSTLTFSHGSARLGSAVIIADGEPSSLDIEPPWCDDANVDDGDQ
jgi:hypothetical protein